MNHFGNKGNQSSPLPKLFCYSFLLSQQTFYNYCIYMVDTQCNGVLLHTSFQLHIQ